MGALKQTSKENKEGKNGERDFTSSEQSNAKKGRAKEKFRSERRITYQRGGAKLEEAKKKSN